MGSEEKSRLEIWSTRQFEPNERYDAWQAKLNDSHQSWMLQKSTATGFSGHLEIGLLGDLKIVRCICDPCSGLRTRREIARDNSAYYGLLLILMGYEEVICQGRRSFLRPGNFLLWDTTIPTHFRLHSRLHKITVFVSQKRMREVLPHADSLVGKAMDWQQGLGAATASFISALGSHSVHMDDRQGLAAAESTLELISSCLWSEHPKPEGRVGADLLARIKTHIETNLEMPGLSPGNLARHFGISVRYLHLLFNTEKVSVSRWILERRLEHCRREFARAGFRKTITEVAFRWGFNDAAHFSRVFKKRYGFSPKDYRRQHSV